MYNDGGKIELPACWRRRKGNIREKRNDLNGFNGRKRKEEKTEMLACGKGRGKNEILMCVKRREY
jgi:hypothetical protein